jgi:Transposase DDE domain
MAKQTKVTLEATNLNVIADRGNFNSEEILECDKAGITVTLPKPITSSAKAEGRFGKQDFRYVAEEERLSRWREARLSQHQRGEWIGSTPILDECLSELRYQTPLHYRQGATDHTWEHAHVLEAVQGRLDEHLEKMRQRRETVEHPVGTIKARMGATHFLMKPLPRVASEMALHVLAYNLTRLMNIMGIQPLMAAI